jgi:hypothetical protein
MSGNEENFDAAFTLKPTGKKDNLETYGVWVKRAPKDIADDRPEDFPVFPDSFSDSLPDFPDDDLLFDNTLYDTEFDSETSGAPSDAPSDALSDALSDTPNIDLAHDPSEITEDLTLSEFPEEEDLSEDFSDLPEEETLSEDSFDLPEEETLSEDSFDLPELDDIPDDISAFEMPEAEDLTAVADRADTPQADSLSDETAFAEFSPEDFFNDNAGTAPADEGTNEFESFDMDDFMSEFNADPSEKQTSPEEAYLNEDPIDIDLQFDDQFQDELKNNAVKDNESIGDFDLNAVESFTVSGFDDLDLDSIVDENQASDSPAFTEHQDDTPILTEFGDEPVPDPVTFSTESEHFNEVSEFDDLLSTFDTPSSEETSHLSRPQIKAEKENDYHLTVSEEDDDISEDRITETAAEADTDDEITVPIYMESEEQGGSLSGNPIVQKTNATFTEEDMEMFNNEFSASQDSVPEQPVESDSFDDMETLSTDFLDIDDADIAILSEEHADDVDLTFAESAFEDISDDFAEPVEETISFPEEIEEAEAVIGIAEADSFDELEEPSTDFTDINDEDIAMLSEEPADDADFTIDEATVEETTDDFADSVEEAVSFPEEIEESEVVIDVEEFDSFDEPEEPSTDFLDINDEDIALLSEEHADDADFTIDEAAEEETTDDSSEPVEEAVSFPEEIEEAEAVIDVAGADSFDELEEPSIDLIDIDDEDIAMLEEEPADDADFTIDEAAEEETTDDFADSVEEAISFPEEIEKEEVVIDVAGADSFDELEDPSTNFHDVDDAYMAILSDESTDDADIALLRDEPVIDVAELDSFDELETLSTNVTGIDDAYIALLSDESDTLLEDTPETDPLAEDFFESETESLDSVEIEENTNIVEISENAEYNSDKMSAESALATTPEDLSDMNLDDMSSIENSIPYDNGSENQNNSDSAHTGVLEKIISELHSIKNEITSLKGELNALKEHSEPEAPTPEFAPDDVPVCLPETEESSGFFSDDETDETIALTGDELNNILISADFTEEMGESVPDESTEGDGELYTDDPEVLDDDTKLDFDENLEEPTPEELEFTDSDIEEALPGEIDLPKELPAEEEADDAETPEFEEDTVVIETHELDEDNLAYLSEEPIQDFIDEPEEEEDLLAEETEAEETEADISEEEASDTLVAEEDAGEEVADTLIPEEDEEETEIFLAVEDRAVHADESEEESAEEELEEDIAEQEEASTIPEDDFEPPADEEIIIETPGECVFEDEPEEEIITVENVLSENEPELDEEIIRVEDEPILEEDEPEEELVTVEDIIAEAAPDVEAEAEVEAETVADSVSTGAAIPDDLREEIKSVLSYMDQLLENLPDDKIEEFAKSEHFTVYKKLFEEMGLS